MITFGCTDAKAGLFAPFLNMMQPRLETTITEECQRLGLRADEMIQRLVNSSCTSLAKPASQCLIKETSRSGREFEVIRELISGRLGKNGTFIVKRCISMLFGFPKSMLDDLDLDQIKQQAR